MAPIHKYASALSKDNSEEASSRVQRMILSRQQRRAEMDGVFKNFEDTAKRDRASVKQHFAMADTSLSTNPRLLEKTSSTVAGALGGALIGGGLAGASDPNGFNGRRALVGAAAGAVGGGFAGHHYTNGAAKKIAPAAAADAADAAAKKGKITPAQVEAASSGKPAPKPVGASSKAAPSAPAKPLSERAAGVETAFKADLDKHNEGNARVLRKHHNTKHPSEAIRSESWNKLVKDSHAAGDDLARRHAGGDQELYDHLRGRIPNHGKQKTSAIFGHSAPLSIDNSGIPFGDRLDSYRTYLRRKAREPEASPGLATLVGAAVGTAIGALTAGPVGVAVGAPVGGLVGAVTAAADNQEQYRARRAISSGTERAAMLNHIEMEDAREAAQARADRFRDAHRHYELIDAIRKHGSVSLEKNAARSVTAAARYPELSFAKTAAENGRTITARKPALPVTNKGSYGAP